MRGKPPRSIRLADIARSPIRADQIVIVQDLGLGKAFPATGGAGNGDKAVAEQDVDAVIGKSAAP